jgi:hypothetical protein
MVLRKISVLTYNDWWLIDCYFTGKVLHIFHYRHHVPHVTWLRRKIDAIFRRIRKCRKVNSNFPPTFIGASCTETLCFNFYHIYIFSKFNFPRGKSGIAILCLQLSLCFLINNERYKLKRLDFFWQRPLKWRHRGRCSAVQQIVATGLY